VGFRFAAVLVGLLPFVLLEAVFHLLDIGRPTEVPDPYVGFSNLHPQFERDADRREYVTTRSRRKFFGTERFAAEKPDNGFRIFCLGGSTVRGRPYTTASAFSKWMEVELSACDSAAEYEIVNCGGLSYASYRLRPILNEVLQYEPDVIVIATGHNEFLEDRTYRSIKEQSAARSWIIQRLYALRTVTVLRQWSHQSRSSSSENDVPQLPDELQSRLDNESGYASYHRDDQWRRGVIAHFEHSLRAMIKRCRQEAVPVVLVRLGSNLRDCPPFKSEHKPGLSQSDQKQWRTWLERAMRADENGDPARAIELYHRAEAIDDEYALLCFRMARCYDRLGQTDKARRYYGRARDFDVCPLRMLSDMSRIVAKIAEETQTPLVDAEALLKQQSPDGIPGNNVYMDHVHPTIGGHQQMAQAIVRVLADRRLLPAGYRRWTAEERRRTYRRHFRRLGGAHYLRTAEARLEWLEAWARRQRLRREIVPGDDRGRLHFGHQLLDLGRPADAWDEYKAVVSQNDRSTSASASDQLLAHARRLFRQGRPETAAWLLEQLRPFTAGRRRNRLEWARLIIALEHKDRETVQTLLQTEQHRLRSVPEEAAWKRVLPDALRRARTMLERPQAGIDN